MIEQPSGKLYTAVTKYWPRIAAGLVLTIGLVEVVVGGLTADSGLEFYLVAWAATTGGLWFLFEKGEKTLSEESRGKVVGWVQQTDLKSGIESIPAQFAFLFDRIFGEKHFSRQCFNRSSAASAFSVLVVWAVYIATVPVLDGTGAASEVAVLAQENGLLLLLIAGAVLVTMPFNFLPDYLSLLETRWTIGLMERTGRVGLILLLDFIATAIISAGGIAILFLIFTGLPDLILLLMGTPTGNTPVAAFRDFVQMALGVEDARYDTLGLPVRVSFLSAFFTSTWLWLYAASVPLSRVLLRMNNGVGFLLRVTDVEKQPFRSMGFVSVIIVSALFALGLPLVLL